MVYDFTTAVNRSHTGSAKWQQMHDWNPSLDDNIYPLSIADVDMKMAPEIIQGLQKFLETAILGYDLPTKEYLSAVKNWMKIQHHWEIEDDWILTIPGVVTSFYPTIRSFTDPGDGVLLLSPVYYPFYAAIEKTERHIVKSVLIQKETHYEIDFADLKKKAKDPANKLLLFSNPHNPVGRVWSKEELAKVIDICVANDVIILADEIHHDLTMPGHSYTPMAIATDDAASICITATAVSKSFNLAGLKNSNIIISDSTLRERFLEDLEETGLDGGTNMLGLKATELAYTVGGPWLQEFKELIWHNHQELKRYFNQELPEVTVFDLEGTFLQWLDFNAFGLSANELEQVMHKEALVFGDEGYIFGTEGNGFERLNLAVPTKILMDALERLVHTMKKYR
ncbi:MalY/PatB family protein [Desemzia sp. FAM 23991]|uniref:MalY/PatB family protein n=1 Tax=unclassified Desemzia TaxID=2685243 RepID=UPI003886744F